MHPNPLFRGPDAAHNLAFARQRGFGVVTTHGPHGPLATHVPFVLSADGAVLHAHLSRANPVVPQLTEPQPALVIVSGPDAYVSPDWYGLEGQVATWNYVAVHLRGRLELAPDDTLEDHLAELAAVHEAQLPGKVPWTAEGVPEARRHAMMQGIVPVRLTIERVEGTWKLGQNKPGWAREAAATAVEAQGYGADTRQLAAMMRDDPPLADG